MTENGEEVVGFGLRKLLKLSPKPTTDTDNDNDDANMAESPPPQSKKVFSLDFPPGLVHIGSECEKSSKKWNKIKRLLEGKKRQLRLNHPK